MDNWFKSKWFVRAISLAFAIVLYIFVSMSANTNEQDSTFSNQSGNLHTIDDVPVDIRIDDENYVVSGVPETVTVSLEGATSILTPTVIQQNFDIYVDLREMEPGNHTVELEYENVPDGLNVYIEPKTVDITIEERATKTFAVTAELVNRDQMADGFEIAEYSISHEEVEITSSKSVISQVGIVKVFIDVSGLDKSINNREVPVNVYDLQGNELNVWVEPENIEVSVEVNNPSKSVSINVPTTGEGPEGYAVSSISANLEEVDIYATSDVLKEVNEVSTEEIDLSDIEESGTIEVGLDLPEKVYAPDVESIEVEVEVEPSRTFDNIPIEIEGLDNEQEITFIDPENESMDVTISGDEADLDELTKEDIRLFIGVEDLDPGEHEVPVTVEIPDTDGLKVPVEEKDQQVTIEID